MTTGPTLWAVSDLHVAYKDNRAIVRDLRTEHPDDRLIVAGDVAERVAEVRWALALLSSRFGWVIWTPGNHELWTLPTDEVQLGGVPRYEHRRGVPPARHRHPRGSLSTMDRRRWSGRGRPAVPAVRLHLPPGRHPDQGRDDHRRRTGRGGLHRRAVPRPRALREPGGLEPGPRDGTEARLRAHEDARLVLVNHHPLIREPTTVLHYPEFAAWCGTERTADWHRRFNVAVAVYGHLHIPRTSWHDGVRFEEVSVGYPREWRRRPRHGWLRRILPEAA